MLIKREKESLRLPERYETLFSVILFHYQVENTLSTYDPHACVIVYSVVDRGSFILAEEILGYLWRIGYSDNGRASIILVANKVDLERSRLIPQEGESL